MEALLILAGLAFLLAWLASIVLGTAGWIRVRALERRVATLQRELHELKPSAPAGAESAARTQAPSFPERTAAPAPAVRPAPAEWPAAGEAGPRPHVSRPTPREPAPHVPAPPGPRPPRIEPAPRIDWERWIGVRGAAVLGGVVLAIAAFLFLQYSIERGLITPRMRCILGALTGSVCIAASFPLRKRGYEVLASSLTGAGAVILYAAAWAAHLLYGLIPFPAAFAAMAAVTAVSGLLAYRHGSQLIAVLGLTGGFATPLVLSSGQDRPLGLFGYVLLLDLGFLFVAHRRRWPTLGLVALLGTFLVQALWIFARLDAARLGLALAILGVFALVFAWWSARTGASETAWVRCAQAGALLLPFTFALYFARATDLGRELWPPAVLALLLSAAAGWLARRQEAPWLLLGTASASVALCLTWTFAHSGLAETPRAWELAACLLAIAAVHHAFAEWRDGRASTRGALAGAAVVELGALGVLGAAAVDGVRLEAWPFVAGAALLALATQRLAALGSSVWIVIAGGALGGVVPLGWSVGELHEQPAASAWIGASALTTVALLLAAARRSEPGRRGAFLAAGAYAVFAPAALVTSGVLESGAPAHQLGACLLFGLLVAVSATGARAGWVLAIAALVTLLAQGLLGALAAPVWTRQGAAEHEYGLAGHTLVALSGAAFAAWPLRLRTAWAGRTWVWRIAALAGLPWMGALTLNLDLLRGRGQSWVGPALFALLLGALAVRAGGWQRAAADARERSARVARTWYAAAALHCAAWVPALLADVEPRFVVAFALWGAGLAWLAVRIQHHGAGHLAAVVIGLATLVLLVLLLEPHERAAWWLSGELAWLCLVPAAAALFCSLKLRAARLTIPALIAGGSAVLCAFVGINLEIAHAWAETEQFRFQLGGQQARDLTTSLAWAVYALVLLVLGVQRATSTPRWASLALLLATIAKVFLIDLGNLTGLYRVGAMLGLALCLILVSLLYQRFVFRRPASAPA